MNTANVFTASPVDDAYLTAPAAAAYARGRIGTTDRTVITARMVKDLRRAGTLKGVHVGRQVLFSKDSIDAWVTGVVAAGSTS